MKVIFISMLLQGCTVFTGVAYHSSYDKPEYQSNNPLGVIRIENKGFFCEHISSIPDTEIGYGINMCGFGVKL